MSPDLVSVVIPTYNSADYLPETLASVFGQTYPDLEVIVVDDGSTDQTGEVIRSLGRGIRYISQENWGGPSRPRNVALAAAQGEFVAFFDSDDLMLPEKISKSMAVLRANPDVTVVFTNFRVIDEGGEVIRSDFLEEYRSFKAHLSEDATGCRGILSGKQAYTELLKANFVGTSSVVCRRQALAQVGPFDETMLNADDVDMWRRLAYAGFTFAYIDEELHSYRRRKGGVSGRGILRYPAIIRGLAKQLELDLGPADKAILHRRIRTTHLAYGSALREVGQFGSARRVLTRSLASSPSIAGLWGLAKTILLQLRSVVAGPR